ncbi:hypothetical protein L210DRAFT_641253 [Boletus edulis BED1]|uniref:Uncharacterized protein n=1 Tax=Boletus edulis BED1 TaxID=1328754 RepID=A0AAD4BRM3_BOLED|nr:hypothetical protein L210DRAFT_641253 [Boletus edulis BED1]
MNGGLLPISEKMETSFTLIEWGSTSALSQEFGLPDRSEGGCHCYGFVGYSWSGVGRNFLCGHRMAAHKRILSLNYATTRSKPFGFRCSVTKFGQNPLRTMCLWRVPDLIADQGSMCTRTRQRPAPACPRGRQAGTAGCSVIQDAESVVGRGMRRPSLASVYPGHHASCSTLCF